MSGLLTGKCGIVFGVADPESSLGSVIVSEILNQGALFCGVTCNREKSFKKVSSHYEQKDLTEKVVILTCDVSDDLQINSACNEFSNITNNTGVDFVVHCPARAALRTFANPIGCTAEDFASAMDVSCRSLIAITNAIQPHLNPTASILTLTSLGSERIINHYGIMGPCKAALEATTRMLAGELGKTGIRVNALSVGPAKTPSTKLIPDFDHILEVAANNVPLRRNVLHEEVGRTAVCLLSEMMSATTGSVVYVDCGAHCAGVQ